MFVIAKFDRCFIAQARQRQTISHARFEANKLPEAVFCLFTRIDWK